ncbi:nucleotidyltransferase family protein [Thiomicrorhabdus aquaedulcis]|uniref:nucleotidyltransferase family protein n=1 Tax=Thiomicrorhabdus aquaedulcis TaxID=2211106 RepID=UPI000FDA310A|nr:nucleotidyltransferase family protein [Thiomicrorhabdus aquaedulcis]
MPVYDPKSISITSESTIKDALRILDKSPMQIVLIVDEALRLQGTLTDGDVRRALLEGGGLNSSVSSAMNTSPTYGLDSENEVGWRMKMQPRGLRHLPILDIQKTVVKLFYIKRGITKSYKNPIVLMLGGLGMRLRPLTETVPKPMLKVGNKPILETIVNHLAEQGFSEFYFCINYLGEQIRQYFGNGENWGINIQYIEEDTPLGTAGALSLLPSQPGQDFIVMNGDLLTKVDVTALLSFHKANQNIITACVREHSQQVPYGVIEFCDGRITQITEKPLYRYFVNAGIYALSPDVFKLLSFSGYYDMPNLMDDLLAIKQPVGGFPLTEYWMDIGQMPDFERAQVDYAVHF